MTTGVLDTPKSPALTRDEPALEKVTKLISTTGGFEDSGLVIVENPMVSRLTGVLIFRRLGLHPYEVELFEAGHYRIPDDGNPSLVKMNDLYKRAIITIGTYGPPHVRITADHGKLIPRPSLVPYQMDPISSDQHDALKRMLGDEKTFMRGARMVFELAAANSPLFTYRDEKLSMPREYASLRM